MVESRLRRFGPIKFRSLECVAIAIGLILIPSCSRSDPAKVVGTTQRSLHSPTVASLSPAATDLIIGMGAADHLVAISSFDSRRTETAGLPIAGDYESTDWESLAAAKPAVLIVQMQESRIPEGFRQHATAIGATILNVQIERLADIEQTMEQIGTAIDESAKASDASHRLSARLDAVHAHVAALPAVRTLICLNEGGTFSAGPGTFLDDVLTIAGGQNVLDASSPHWPTIDRERLTALAPSAVMILLPAATPQVLKASGDFWSKENVKTTTITDAWALTPGIEVGELAERMATALHPTIEAAR